VCDDRRMSLIGAVFYIEVHGIMSDREVLGQSLNVVRESERLRIDFPEGPESFTFMHGGPPAAQGAMPDPRDYTPTTAVLDSGSRLVEIRLLKVVVSQDAPLSIDTWDEHDSADAALYQDVLLGMSQKATDLAGELCERLKLDLGQHWIEPAGTYPRVVNMAGLTDVQTGKSFGTFIGSAGSFRVLDPSTVLVPDSLPGLEEKLRSGSPDADELLLAEAKHVVETEQAAAFNRATLLAAIAVELRTKRLLRTLAGPDRALLLELLLDNPNDWSMAAHRLFKKAIPQMLGRDMGPEHRALSKRVERLFVDRNLIAHKGASVSREGAVSHVDTAWEAFDFMAGLSPR